MKVEAWGDAEELKAVTEIDCSVSSVASSRRKARQGAKRSVTWQVLNLGSSSSREKEADMKNIKR